MVECFECDKNVIRDEAVGHEGTLGLGHKLREDFFQSVGNGFRDYFVYDIA